MEPPGSIFLRFLKFGALAWGGPAAQIAMVKHECVDEEGWVSEETFKKTLAVYQVLPGPEAHELCVYFGRVRGGKLGGFLAGLGFMLPGFLLMLALSILYVEADLAGHLDDLFYGLSAAVGAIVLRAVVRLSGTFVTDAWLAAIAVGAFVLTAFLSAHLRARPARRRARLRAAHECRALDRAGALVLTGAARGRRHGRGGDALAHRRDLPRGPEGRAAHLRRRLHGDPVPPAGRRRPTTTG